VEALVRDSVAAATADSAVAAAIRARHTTAESQNQSRD
jgi:hypothetical protein